MWSKPTNEDARQPSSCQPTPVGSQVSHKRSFSETGPSPERLPGMSSQQGSVAQDITDTPRREAMQLSTSHMSSITADSRSGPVNPTAADRVFPIKSVVSLDPTATPSAKTDIGHRDGCPGMNAPASTDTERSYSSRTSTSSNPSIDSTHDVRTADSPLEQRRNPTVIKSSNREAQQPIPKVLAASQQVPIRQMRERMGGARQVQTFVDNESIMTHHIAGQDSDDQSVTGSIKSGGSGSTDDTKLREETGGGGLLTARFKHIVTKEGHAVIIGRDGDTMQRCEDEPIHIPGAVQGFGLLIALQEVEDGKLLVRIVSENSKRLIGYTPKHLFDLDSFCDILSEEQTDNLLDQVDFIRDEDVDPATNGPEVFTLSIRSPSRKTQKMWCAMHINESNRDLIICEFELEDDALYPLVPAGEATPEPPEDTLNSDPTPEEYAESTVNASRPLRVLRSARKRKGEAAAMEVFNIMSQVQEQLANAPTLESFLKILVGVVKELTGFHRVMVYQFDAAWNGRVVTELVDPRATKDLYKGLNFPASDIPKQARDMYKINKVRLLYDRDQETARLVCRTTQDLEKPLDLTFAYLRAMSPIHIKYLSHMAVRASMSISINAFNELWGLIACHSYGSKGMRVSFPIRKMCRLVGDSASRNIERLSYASRLQARKLIDTVPTPGNPSGYIIASSDDLLNLFDADYGLLSIRDETKILGKLEQMQEALALLEYFRLRKITSVTNSTDVRIDFPDLRYSHGFSVIAGLLLVPLSVTGLDFIVFFRKGQTREVKWAGNPYEKFVKEGTEGYLEPRKSFKTWSETVSNKCREWTEEQIETAAVLCLVYGKFIEVWRQKEAAFQNSQLTKLLLANSAHEVRTPLNAIINYLEIALEGPMDEETRDNLSRSHSASKSLVYVINDLLDLTKTEQGHDLIKDENFDLRETMKEAIDSFKGDAKRKGIDYNVVHNSGIPQFVVGDQRRVRQAISNVAANAIQHTSQGFVKVETWLASKTDERVEIDILVQDTGCGMGPEILDALFRDLEQVQTEEDEGLQEKLAGNNKILENKDGSKRILGLGLALVARLVRNTNGQLRLKSEEGKGSRFIIQLGFDLPADEDESKVMEAAQAAGIAPPSDQPATPPVETGEIMLVNKSTQKSRVRPARDMAQRKSTESVRSVGSFKSFKSQDSAKSDVDRLIEAIQEPTMVPKAGGDEEAPRPSSMRNHRRQESNTSSGRPTGALLRAQSSQSKPGTLTVEGSQTPIRSIRMPGQNTTGSPTSEQLQKPTTSRTPSRVLFDIPNKDQPQSRQLDAKKLQVLVAEDDPINSKIIQKRLEKIGHVVHLTINGEECSSAFGERGSSFDVVLMDMQMPIVDGLTSTKMIRSFEKTHRNTSLSKNAALNCRIPIFAVSASLEEKQRQTYIDGGFDGWVLKPIDFKRLCVLLSGITESSVREGCLYTPGHWEQGGWFGKQQEDVFTSNTRPSSMAPVSSLEPEKSYPAQPQESATDKERARLQDLDDDAVHANSFPSNPGQSGNLQRSLEGE